VAKRYFLCLLLTLFFPSIVNSISGAPLPDLIVEDITWIPQNPQAGEAIQIQVHIRNIGDAPVTNIVRYKLELDMIAKIKNPIYGEFDDIPFEPGKKWVGNFTLIGGLYQKSFHLSEGDHELQAEVDYMLRVPESNEKNNILTKTIHIGSEVTTLEYKAEELPSTTQFFEKTIETTSITYSSEVTTQSKTSLFKTSTSAFTSINDLHKSLIEEVTFGSEIPLITIYDSLILGLVMVNIIFIFVISRKLLS
jgi:hypothetical protein